MIMKKSKLLIPFLCFVAVLTLVGCDKEPGGTGNENPPVTDVEEFTVTFNTNGGSAVAAQKVKSGDKATKPADPTRDGYVFDGWFVDVACENSWDFNNPITSAMKLYAKWNEDNSEKFTVTFNTNGGSTIESIISFNIASNDALSFCLVKIVLS